MAYRVTFTALDGAQTKWYLRGTTWTFEERAQIFPNYELAVGALAQAEKFNRKAAKRAIIEEV